MSRIGRSPIKIPENVEVTIEGDLVTVKHANNELSITKRPEIDVVNQDGELVVTVKLESKKAGAYWGLTRALINNMIKGVTAGYEKKLELVGVGYRAKSVSDGMVLTLGYSHPVEFKKPDGIELIVEDNKNITVKGIDKQLVGLTAAKIRSLRKPEPYKGKGIRYSGEVVKTKPGKAGKVQ